MRPKMTKTGLRRWVENWRVVNAVQREELRNGRQTAREAMDEAQELLDFAIETHGWPLPEDPLEERDRARIEDAWSRLRRHFGIT